LNQLPSLQFVRIGQHYLYLVIQHLEHAASHD